MRKIRTLLYESGEFRVYRMPGSRALTLADSPQLGMNALDDIRAYEPDEAWHLGRNEFLCEARARIDARSVMYSAMHDGRFAHWSWLTFPASDIECDFAFGHLSLPPGSARLWDDNTVKSARGRGFQSASIRRRARDAAQAGAEWLYIGVRADNGPSRRNIENAGFELAVQMFYVRILGFRRQRIVHIASPITVG